MGYNALETPMETLAKDIMTTELIVGHPEMTLEEAIKILFNSRITGLPVVDTKNRMIGVVTEYDIIRSVRNKGHKIPLSLKKKIRFTRKVTVVSEETELDEILGLFIDKKVRRLPVLDAKGRLVGIISRRDIMRLLFYRSKEF